MKRAPLVISGTVAGLVGLFSFHSKAATLNLNSLVAGSSSTQNSPGATPKGSATTTTSPPTTSTQPNNSQATTPSTSSPNTTSPATSTTQPVTKTTTPPTTTAPPSAARTATGPVVNYYFGTVSVSVSVSGKKITNISIASLNDGGNPRSQQIDQYALPQLEQQALAANGVNIQGVSGATYTSQGFAQTLQGALSKVGL